MVTALSGGALHTGSFPALAPSPRWRVMTLHVALSHPAGPRQVFILYRSSTRLAPDQETDAAAKNIVSDPVNPGIRVSPVPFRAGQGGRRRMGRIR